MTTTDQHLTCDGCGVRTWDRADMLEAWFPRYAGEIAPGITITPLTLGWVGPCCAELANRWQPGDPEEA
jgi:hypothetical protein